MTIEPSPDEASNTLRRSWDRAIGAGMMAIGGMIAAACGLCTLFVAWPDLARLVNPIQVVATETDPEGFIPTFAPAVGGLPALIGLAIALKGFSIHRRANRETGAVQARGRLPSSREARNAYAGGCLMAVGGAVVWLSGGTFILSYDFYRAHGIFGHDPGAMGRSSFLTTAAVTCVGLVVFLAGVGVFRGRFSRRR